MTNPLHIAYFPHDIGHSIELIDAQPALFYSADNGRVGGSHEWFLAVTALKGSRFITLNGRVRRVGHFDMQFERELFEETMYAHYMRVREQRAQRGQGVVGDTELPRAPEELFARASDGSYVAVVYQSAWSGWKMARGAAW